jgi:Spy/CpxP family protein refolding chaperone
MKLTSTVERSGAPVSEALALAGETCRFHLKEATMKTSLRSWCIGSSLVIALAVGTLVTAQEKKADTTKATAKTPAEPAKKAVHRVPQYYGQLDLTDEQKTKIYSIQDSYKAQLEELRAKIDALEAKEDSEINAVLKPEQLKKLAEVKAAADKKKTDNKAKKEEAKKTEKADATKKTVTTKTEEIKK